MKKITIFLFFFIGVFIYPIVTIYCQAPDISIQKSYDIEYYTRFHDFKQTSDGGYLICGSSSEIGTTLYDDIIIIKTNSDGETVWIKRIGETENSEYANCIQLTSDDGSIIAGHNWGTKTTLVIKLDDEGSIIWNKEYHAESEQQSVANYIQKTNDNNFVITGKVKNAPSGSGEEDVFLFKVNNDGDLIWEKIYGGTNIDIAWKVEQLDDNGFLIFGTTQSFGAEYVSLYLIKTDSEGNQEWKKIKNYTDDHESYGSAKKMQDDNYILVAQNDVIKTDSDFEKEWRRDFQDLSLTDIYPISNGFILLVKDLLMKLDGDGFEDWRMSIGSDNNAGLITSDGCFVIIGDDDDEEGYLYKTESFIQATSIRQINLYDNINVHSNYNNDILSIVFNETTIDRIKLKIYNSTGQIIYNGYNINPQINRELEIKLPHTSNGLYFLTLYNENISLTKKLFILK